MSNLDHLCFCLFKIKYILAYIILTTCQDTVLYLIQSPQSSVIHYYLYFPYEKLTVCHLSKFSDPFGLII